MVFVFNVIQVQTRRRRTRTVKVRTALSSSYPAGQTDNGQLFCYNPDRIRTESRQEKRTERHRTGFVTKFQTESGQLTESRQQTDTGHDFPENHTKTRQGQDTDSAVRRSLVQTETKYETFHQTISLCQKFMQKSDPMGHFDDFC